MTRVNVVPVEELSDQWLLAEYRELPRCIKQNINTADAPEQYKLGTGHMKWAKAHIKFLFYRYQDLCIEMQKRNFNVNHPSCLLFHEYQNEYDTGKDYIVTDSDIRINRERLIQRYRAKPDFYRWTGRNKPFWLK